MICSPLLLTPRAGFWANFNLIKSKNLVGRVPINLALPLLLLLLLLLLS